MVTVRKDQPIAEDGKIDLDAWIDRISSQVELAKDGDQGLKKALQMSLQYAEEQDDTENIDEDAFCSFRTGLEMAEILAELQLDLDTLIAAILYHAVRENSLPLTTVGKEFGADISTIIQGVLRMATISQLRNDSDADVFGRHSEEQTGNVRKMLVAMVDDVRVALVKLAERTCAIRAAKNSSAEIKLRVAREVADVYAPLAHRLGIGHIKWELEDLSFRYLESEAYIQIAKLLDEKRLARQTYIDEVIGALHRDLKSVSIEADISGRAKHIYSIWRKMRRKDIGFSQVYDIRAVRILVPTVRDCYGVLGVVHSLWRNIPKEFDDYIASPKENGYRSLHTAVIGPEGKVLEVQIRTFSMHEEAEYGVCSHWRYKGTDDEASLGSYDAKIAWLRQVLEWHDESGGGNLHNDLSGGFEQDSIYVFTPDGHIIDLPEGSTPVDFAYRIHTDVGNRCCGAKVNGRIVPLNHQLLTADQVSVLTNKRESPSRDWLSPALGYIHTARARAKVQQWFKLQAKDQNIADGRSLLDKEFKRLALADFDFEKLAKKLNMSNLETLYAAVGANDVGVAHVINAAQRMLPVDSSKLAIPLTGRVTVHKSGSDIYIEGVGNLLTNIARCCGPVPGEEIVGYITLGKGVSVHKEDCRNILKFREQDSKRIIKVEWGEEPENTYTVSIEIEAYDRYGLLRDITSLLDSERINVSAMQTVSNKNKNTVDMIIKTEVRSFSQLSHVLARLNQLPNVASARRMHEL